MHNKHREQQLMDDFNEALNAVKFWRQQARELEEENIKLRAVAEAVLDYRRTCTCVECCPKNDKLYWRCYHVQIRKGTKI